MYGAPRRVWGSPHRFRRCCKEFDTCYTAVLLSLLRTVIIIVIVFVVGGRAW